MKTLFKISLSVAILLLPSFISKTSAQTVSSENGFTLPVNPAIGHNETIIKVLLIWAEVTNTYTTPSVVTGFGEGALPSDANTFFEPDFSLAATTQAYVTRYFYDASFGKCIMLGDWLDHKIQITPALLLSYSSSGYDPIYGYLNGMISNSQALFESRLAGGSVTTDFDQWSVVNLPQYRGVSKPNIPNTKADVVIILWTNHPNYTNGGDGLTVHTASYQMGNFPDGFSGTDNDAAFVDGGGMNAKLFIVEEYFHALFGHNNWHTGGGAGPFTFYEGTNPWGLPAQMAAVGMSNVANGWDRFHLGWENPAKTYLTSALDGSGNEVNTEMVTWQSIVSGSEFILRDFVTTGDAIRIKMPH